MSLSDVIGGLGASAWQQAALVIFSVAFLAILANAWLRRKSDVDACARLPLDDDRGIAPAPRDRQGREGAKP